MREEVWFGVVREWGVGRKKAKNKTKLDISLLVNLPLLMNQFFISNKLQSVLPTWTNQR